MTKRIMDAPMHLLIVASLAMGVLPCWAGKEYDAAVELIKNKKYDVARTLLQAELKKKDSAKVRYALGYCAEKTGNTEKALAIYGFIITKSVGVSADASTMSKVLKRVQELKPEAAPVFEVAGNLTSAASGKKKDEREYLYRAARMLYAYALGRRRERLIEAGTPSVVGAGNGTEKVQASTLGGHKEGAQKYGDHYYKVFPEKLTWLQAQAKCKEMGGYLATVTSKEENEFVQKLGPKGSGWIGLYLKGEDWQWVTGEKPGYFNWRKRGHHRREKIVMGSGGHVAMLSNGSFFSADGVPEWLDGFICEWEK